MFKLFSRRFAQAAMVICLCFAARPARAQGTAGSIQGTVIDDSGANIPGAKLTARDLDTGRSFASESNDAGLFLLGQIPPGRYEVTAEKAGFGTAIQQGITVRVNDQLHLDFALKVGAVKENISVSAEMPLLKTEDNVIGKVIEERTIKQLPLSGRNAFSLTLLTPGAQQATVSNGTGGDTQPRLSGGRSRTGEFMLDGTSVTDPRRGDTVVAPNLDAIQEFDVQTNGIPAEFGRLTGGIVTAALKSGTNQFHGNVFEFYRGSSLAARNFFSATVPRQVYNQFGGILGGPIRRDRTFFFVDYQGTRNRQQSIFNLTLPTAQQLSGNFAQNLGRQVGTDALGRPVLQGQIFDPATTRTAPNGQLVRDPFPNNAIPVGRIDPIAARVVSLYPATNRPGLSQNFSQLQSGGLNQDQFDVRVDHRFTDKDLTFVRVSRDRQENITARPYSSSLTGGNLGQVNTFYTTSLNWTRTLNPSTLNDLRFGSLRGGLSRSLAVRDIGSLGIPNVPLQTLPQFSLPGYDSLGDAPPFDPVQESYQVEDVVTLVRGRHIIKAGADFRRFRINDLQLNATIFTFSQNQTSSPASGATGNPISSLLLGLADQYTTDPNRGRFYLRSDYLGLFVQDTFKVSRNLTLNLGVRYDIEQQPNELRSNGSNFNLITGQVETMAQLGRNRIQDTDNNNFGPRVGFAWKPWSSKFVLRSSYGLFYTPLTGRATSAYNRWPQSQPFTVQSSGLNPALQLSQVPPVIRSTTGYGQAQQHNDGNAPVAYFQQWNFDVQRQLPGNAVVQVSYVGNVGRHLMANIQYNEIPLPVVRANGGGSQRLRPYPNFPNIGTFCECQSSSYHAFELSAEKRYSGGLNFLLSYTYSKFLDQQNDNFSALFPQTSYNTRLEKGLSISHIPHRFVLSSVYDLPFGPKRSLLRSGFWSHVAGGWQTSGILTLQSGQQVWIRQANNTAQTFSQQFRPNLTGTPTLGNDARTLGRYFNTDAFAAPAPLTLGTSNKTPDIQGPGWVNVDFALHRDIRIPLTEQSRIELRGECFNCMNHTNFNPPIGIFGTPTFGQITSALPGRTLQIAGKFWF